MSKLFQALYVAIRYVYIAYLNDTRFLNISGSFKFSMTGKSTGKVCNYVKLTCIRKVLQKYYVHTFMKQKLTSKIVS